MWSSLLPDVDHDGDDHDNHDGDDHDNYCGGDVDDGGHDNCDNNGYDGYTGDGGDELTRQSLIYHLAMSGLGDAVEDLRAATCRLGRELFRPVGPDNEDGSYL